MTTYYVGAGGNDANAGTSWALRKLTLNGAEDKPVAAGDTVYVGPGTYRELLTLDVSGSGGSPITYIGDYTGANTDGVGGVVRITGSDNDQTIARATCITGTSRTYRTFTGFVFDSCSDTMVLGTNATNWIVQNCFFSPGSASPSGGALTISGTSQAACTVQNCYFSVYVGQVAVWFQAGSVVDNAGHTVQNCIFNYASEGITFARIGGNTVKNCIFLYSRSTALRVSIALTAGQTETVNNCVFQQNLTALSATATGEITENYNTFFANSTNRTNTNTGANSLTYPALLDPRWFFQLIYAGAGPNSVPQLVTPFDLSSFSQLINVAGTSPTTTDMRGTAVQGSQREWGALEYDSTLQIKGKSGISRSRAQ